MPSLNFKPRFAASVSQGSKPHTIRAWRKRPFRVGDNLAFFTGMRTKQCRRLRPNARCSAVSSIEVRSLEHKVVLDGKSLNRRQIEELACRDGFPGSAEFWDFFADTHGPVLRGQLIQWKP